MRHSPRKVCVCLAAAVEFALARLRRAPMAGSGPSFSQASIEPLEARQLLSGWLSANSAATWDAPSSTLTVTGAATIIADPGSDEPNIVADGSGAQLTIAPTGSPVDVHVGGITLSGGASIDMASVGPFHSNSNHNTLVVGVLGATNDPTFSIDSASTLDLQDNDLIVHTGSSDANGAAEYANVNALATQGRHPASGAPGSPDGQWNGGELDSSAANAADAAVGYEQVGLGVVVNSSLFIGPYSSWQVGSANETLAANDLIVKYDFLGDYGLFGKVYDSDAAILQMDYDNGAHNNHTWATGSSMGNGLSDANEATLFNRQYGLGVAPSGLQALSSDASSVSLKWTPATGASSYNIYRQGPGDGSMVEIESVAGNASTYTDDSADSDTAYSYQVTAVFALGETTPTNTVTARTLSDTTAGYDTLWASSQAPQNPSVFDSNAGSGVELGVQFSSDVGGYLSGIQFFKGAQDSGTHTGELWDASGDLLATATFTEESQSGWQQVDFSSPVLIAGGTPYTVSYHTTSTYYPNDGSYFSSEYNSTPLHVAPNVNGVYSYGASAFPATAAGNANNYWVQPVFFSATEVPAALAATTASASEIDLSWNNIVPNVSAIDVQRSTDGVNFTTISTLAPGATRYPDLGLADNSAYTYQLIFQTSSGLSLMSLPAVGYTLAVVGSLQAQAISTSEIDLSWNCNDPNATGFEIQQSSDSGATWSTLTVLSGAGTNQYQDLGLQADSDLFFRVRAELPSGPSNYSDDVEMSSLPATPAAPTVTLNGDQIDLQWPAASTNDTGIILERSTDGTDYSPVATDGDMGADDALDPTATGYVDSNLSDATTYYYELVLQNIGGLSSASPPVSLSVPIIAPTGLAATVPQSSTSQIQLAWTNNSDTASIYLQRSDSGGAFSTIAVLAEPVTTYTDSSLVAGTQYSYQAEASDGGQTSAPSNVATATTAPALALSVSPSSGIVDEGQSCSLTVSPQYESGLPDPIVSLSINWGDGSTDNPGAHSGAFTHVYATAGLFTIIATASTAAGPVSASTSAQVNVITPSLTLTPSTFAIQPGASITVVPALSNLPAGAVINGWLIDWGDDGQTQNVAGSADVSAGFTHSYPLEESDSNDGGYAEPADFVASVAADTSVGVFTASASIQVIADNVESQMSIDVYVDPVTGATSPPPVESQPSQIGISLGSIAGTPPSSLTVDFGDGSTGQATEVYTYPEGGAYYLATHTYSEEDAYNLTATGGGYTGYGTLGVAEDAKEQVAPIADQNVVPGDALTISAAVSGLGANDSYSGYLIGLGSGPQQVTLTNNGDGTGTVSYAFGSVPEGDFNLQIALNNNEDALPCVSANFALHSHYLVSIDGPAAGGEAAARAAAEPTGKMIGVDNADLNGNGIPDFAEGFNDIAPPTTEEGTTFVPMVLSLPIGWDPASTQINILYSGSDPADVTRTGSGTRTDPYLYHPGTGALRVWDQPESLAREESDYIAPGAYVNASDPQLQWSGGSPSTVTLYVEAIAPSQGLGDQTITVRMIKNASADEGATILTDSVKVMTVETAVAVDANRDGSIELDGTDETSASAPYQFWLNDGTDQRVETGSDVTYYASVNGGTPNSTTNHVVNASDLENYAHMLVQVPLTATNGNGVLSPDWSATIQYVPASGSPVISIIPLPSEYGQSADGSDALDYMNDVNAVRALGGGLPTGGGADLTEGADVEGLANFTVMPLPVDKRTETSAAMGTNGYLNYLFEGVTAGSGAVTVRWLYKGQVVVQNSFSLQLQTITQMYEQASVEYPWVNKDTDTITLGDLRDPGAPTIPTNAKIYNEYAPSSPLDNQVIVFVPGWRMKPSQQEAFADTAFKRLYWQGYTGRFISFLWPTEWTDTANKLSGNGILRDLGNFDRSDQKAYASGLALHNLLTDLDTEYGYQNVNIFAHSMGNVVVSEALRLGGAIITPLVNTYIASQAAVPAEAYDPNATGSNDEFANFLGTGTGYFAGIGANAPHMYNFLNPADYALYNWGFNGVTKSPEYGHGPQPDLYIRQGHTSRDPVKTLDLQNTADRYEVFAFAIDADGKALGAQTGVGGPFYWGGSFHDVNLQSLFGFTGAAWDHSAEFIGTEQQRAGYWHTLLSDFKAWDPGINQWQH